MTEQRDEAAERSAEVVRAAPEAPRLNLIIDRGGVPVLRVVAELRDENARLLAERDAAVEARAFAVREMADMARQAGSWQGVAEGKDAIIRELEAEAARLREAVTRAAAQFSYYEQQHRAKGTADADAKADTNRDMAAMLRAALGETTDGR